MQQQHHMQNITIHPTNNVHNGNNQSSPQLSSHHQHQPPNPTLSILNNGNSNDNNNNLSSKSENINTRSNKIVIKKTSTTTITTNHSSIILTSSGVKTIVGKYNRRNNPELEKRRIHHCDFMGKLVFNPNRSSMIYDDVHVHDLTLECKSQSTLQLNATNMACWSQEHIDTFKLANARQFSRH